MGGRSVLFKAILEKQVIPRQQYLQSVCPDHGLHRRHPEKCRQILANREYSIAVFRFTESAKGLKFAFLLHMLMFAVFNVAILNYVGAVSCAVEAVTTILSLAAKL